MWKKKKKVEEVEKEEGKQGARQRQEKLEQIFTTYGETLTPTVWPCGRQAGRHMPHGLPLADAAHVLAISHKTNDH